MGARVAGIYAKEAGHRSRGRQRPPKKNVNGPRVGSTNGPKSIVAEKGDGLAALFGNKKGSGEPEPLKFMVRAKGLEPSWGCPHTDLNRTRLPIPPRPQMQD